MLAKLRFWNTIVVETRRGSAALVAGNPGRTAHARVASDRLRRRPGQVRKHAGARPDGLAHEPAALQHADRASMRVVHPRVAAPYAVCGGERDDRHERFRAAARTPGVAPEHVAGRGAVQRFEGGAFGAEQPTIVARLDEQRPPGQRAHSAAAKATNAALAPSLSWRGQPT
jgi:hypothetical protein